MYGMQYLQYYPVNKISGTWLRNNNRNKVETLRSTGRSIHPENLPKENSKKQLLWNACDELLSESQGEDKLTSRQKRWDARSRSQESVGLLTAWKRTPSMQVLAN